MRCLLQSVCQGKPGQGSRAPHACGGVGAVPPAAAGGVGVQTVVRRHPTRRDTVLSAELRLCITHLCDEVQALRHKAAEAIDGSCTCSDTTVILTSSCYNEAVICSDVKSGQAKPVALRLDSRAVALIPQLAAVVAGEAQLRAVARHVHLPERAAEPATLS